MGGKGGYVGQSSPAYTLGLYPQGPAGEKGAKGSSVSVGPSQAPADITHMYICVYTHAQAITLIPRLIEAPSIICLLPVDLSPITCLHHLHDCLNCNEGQTLLFLARAKVL